MGEWERFTSSGPTEYEIGRRYLVPIVRGQWMHEPGDWPVLGPLHDDKEYIGFELPHYHLDLRFLSEKQWSFVTRHDIFDPFNAPLHDYPQTSVDGGMKLEHLGLQWRVCRRWFPQYPEHLPKWLPKLEEAFKDAKVCRPALRCPHKGADLRGLSVRNGCVTCPLHGLRWSNKDGTLVPRKPAG